MILSTTEKSVMKAITRISPGHLGLMLALVICRRKPSSSATLKDGLFECLPKTQEMNKSMNG
jgi:hypothetical protein